MKWEELKRKAESLKSAALSYEEAYNDIKASIENNEAFEQVCSNFKLVIQICSYNCHDICITSFVVTWSFIKHGMVSEVPECKHSLKHENLAQNEFIQATLTAKSRGKCCR